MITLRSILRSLWESEQPPLSVETLARVAQEQRARTDAHEHAMVLGREELGPHPFASDPTHAKHVRVLPTAIWELEQQAKAPERRIAPIPRLREAGR